VLFSPPIANLVAKNRFSRRFILVQKGDGCTCRQNEFLFKLTATNTHLFAICSKMKCVLPLNAVQYGAKRSAFWCKIQCVLVLNARKMVQNAVQNGAKCEAKSINIHCNGINKTI